MMANENMSFNGKWDHVARLVLAVVILLLAVDAVAATWKEKVLYSFQGGNDGAVPAGGVVFDKAGNLYGATADGGSGCSAGSCGTVFQLVAPPKRGGAWSENILHNFAGNGQGDGYSPEGGLLIDAAGNLYGTTAYGGTGNCTLSGSKTGCGTVYEMVRPKQKGGQWTEKILYNFQGDKDGQFPIGDLIFDNKGNLYGATFFGGGFGSCDDPFYQHCGTIFELVAPKTKVGQWTETVLYSFKNGPDGATPNGGLTFDQSGAVYGTTYSGGKVVCPGGQGPVGCGVVFKLIPRTKAQWTERLVHSFTGGTDGYRSSAGLVFDGLGNLYGTTTGGGDKGGVLFRLAPPRKKGDPWTEAILHEFTGGNDGVSPMGRPVFDWAGNLYGAARGGKLPGGVVFRLAPQGSHWAFSVLYNLAGPPDGQGPDAPLRIGRNGSIYGTTTEGGTGESCQSGCGTVFRVSH
jgi:hypothetical protein